MNAPATVLELLAARPATLGTGRLVCIDGPAGSGKTTLAEAVAQSFDGASRLLHMDDMYPGWSGLPRVDEQLDGLLTPLGEGRAGSYRRYDWVAGEFAETVPVEPVPLLVLEGVGSGASRFAPLQTVLVWVEAPHDLRMRRGIERDGDAFAPYWEQWAADEQLLFAREGTRERADVHVDGTRPY
ncbi:4-amino-4-deoxy-L-arabinose transferase [Marmoricola sp. URHB0036]|uniref:4-amino-4-deoxy-L-arabinose transferase n=1 Tax=Marmoricola sp. URHB0036 TaxID=1298863 RepID=UPI000403DE84|nr:4-amino-4-deoxy-L-arabinose transferase [Marmoricola sp. URHB0036]